MKCHIPGPNVKVLGKAIQTLSRIGDELYVEPHADGVFFRTVNAQRSAFASFNFSRSFFVHFSATENVAAPSQSQANQEPEKCKVPMKSCLSVFRTQNLNIETCKLFFGQGAKTLVFQLCCRHSITKTYNVPVIETETLQASYNKNSTQNKLLSQSKVLIDALSNFQKNQDEITVTVTGARMVLRNFTDAGEAMKNTVRTELALESTEFDALNVGVDTTITFSLKELRALLGFAEAFNIPVSGHFDTAGRPIVFCVNNQPSFEAQFVLATMTENDTFSQSQSISSQRSVSEVARKRPSTSIDQSQSSKRASQQPPENEAPETPVMSLDEDDLEQIQMLEERALSQTGAQTPSQIGTPPEIRAQRFYFPRCFKDSVTQPRPVSPSNILAYDSQGEEDS